MHIFKDLAQQFQRLASPKYVGWTSRSMLQFKSEDHQAGDPGKGQCFQLKYEGPAAELPLAWGRSVFYAIQAFN